MTTYDSAIRSLARQINTLRREMRAQARAAQGARRSVELSTGAVSYYDEDGVERLQMGLQDDGSYTVLETNSPPPPQPTAPDALTVPGGIRIVYDGTYEDGNATADFSHTEVHMSVTAGFEPTDATQIHSFQSVSGGEFFVPVADGDPRAIALVAVNNAGVESLKSEEAIASADVFPGASDGVPPSATPAPIVRQGLGCLFVLWDTVVNDDPVIVDAYMSTVSGFAPGPTNHVGSAPGIGPIVVRTLTDGTRLLAGTTYYVKIIARDEDGVGPTSTEASGTPAQALTDEIALLAITTPLIANGAVTTPTIANLAIDTSKLGTDSVTAVKILAGSIETDKLAANAVTAAKIAANTITAGQIAAGTITATQIAAATITANELAANSITTGKIVAGAVTTNELAANSVTAAKIAANTITAGQIAANTITAGQIASNTITAAQIAAATITATQIAAGTITATQIAAGTITTTQIAANTITTSDLSATAIDGMTITGALIRTASSGNRIEVLQDASAGAINYYTGNAAETAYGFINPDVANPSLASKAGLLKLRTPDFGHGYAQMRLWSDAADNSVGSIFDVIADTISFVGLVSSPDLGNATLKGTTVFQTLAGSARGTIQGIVGDRIQGATTNASSEVTISHGLGTTPTLVVIGQTSNHMVRVSGRSSTNITFEYRVSSTGALTGSGASVSTDWLAVLL